MVRERKYKLKLTYNSGRERIYYCIVCGTRLKVGYLKLCSDKCRQINKRTRGRLRYHRIKNDKRLYVYKRRIADRKRCREWHKMSDADKEMAMMEFAINYLRNNGGENNEKRMDGNKTSEDVQAGEECKGTDGVKTDLS